jgi:hypothetical protein
MAMNTYQKVALIAGIIALLVIFGKTLTKISVGAMAFMGKGIIIVIATVLILLAFRKQGKNK